MCRVDKYANDLNIDRNRGIFNETLRKIQNSYGTLGDDGPKNHYSKKSLNGFTQLQNERSNSAKHNILDIDTNSVSSIEKMDQMS